MPRIANLYAALRAGFPTDLDRIAIETLGGEGGAAAESHAYSWRDLDHGSAMIANLLQSLKLERGARIAVQTEKSVEAVMLYLAVLRAGCVYLPLNTAYRAAEIEYFIGNAEPAVLVCTSAEFGVASKIAFRAGTAHVFTLDDDRTGSLLQRALHHSREQAPVPVRADDLAAILYTSGTTGRSKGAMLSHANLLSNAEVLKAYWGWREGDVLIHALPIFHVHGLFVALHGALLNGSPMLWSARFDPKAVVAALPRATVFMGVPTLYVRLLGEAGLTREACRRMRLFISGSAPLLIDTFTEFERRTGHTILERYGMSETVMLTSNPYDPADGERRGGTVGFALPGVGVRLRDDAGAVIVADAGATGVAGDGDGEGDGEGDGDTAATSPIGAIEVTGPNVFAGYWRMPEKTAEDFTADGWFRTGDVGRFDAEGYLTIVGRSKDLVISGGYNVYPAEVEGVINTLPGVAESAVVGVPHPDFGEGVIAFVVARPGATLEPARLLATLKNEIANFKVPKHIVVVDALPRNAMGKVQKNLLREQQASRFTQARA